MRVFNLVVVMALALGVLPFSSGSGSKAAAASPGVQPAAVQTALTTRGGSGFDRTLLAPHPLPPVAEENVAAIDPFLRQQDGPLHVVIELEGDPTTVIYARTLAGVGAQFQAQATRAAQAQLARIEAAQQQLLAPLSQLDATVLYRTQRVYNGIAVLVDAQHLDQIAALPGVKAIHRLVPKTLEHTTSVPLIGAPELWTGTGLDLTGAGITVGIIDSGVDYIHTDFGGSGAAGAYAANDTTVINDTYNGALLFPTAKVVGGWDFVGDAYDAGGTITDTVPHPDPDPAGCLTGGESADHGTHVAGTAAGYGVNQDGTTYSGPYNSTLDFSQFRIGPGVAPQASLYSLRVFGCNGSSNVVEAAIEWAMDPNGDGDFSDHLDIINMSLGSDYGSNYDTTSVASNNAALAGMIVVAAAGNATDVYYVAGSPASGSRVLSVASSRDRSAVLDGFRVNAPSGIAGVYGAALSVAYDWDGEPGVTGAVVYPNPGTNPAQNQRTGCYTFDITNTQMISGNIVILDWSEPSCGGSVSRTGKAVAAGATGVIIVDNSTVFDLLITGSSVVPSISAPKSVGDMLKANLLSGLNASLVVDYRNSVMYTDSTMEDTLSAFSSRGPRRYDSALKPDVTAPGDSIFSAANGTGNEGLNYSGTSMATPHMAGAMALLRQLHPDWSVEELKALVMDTASHDVHTDPPAAPLNYGPGRVGAGRADLAKAAMSPLIAYVNNGSGLVSVSFGAPEISTPYTATRQVRVVNKSPDSVVYTARYQGVVDMPGVQYTVSPALIRLAPYRVTTVQVTMTADPAQMRRAMDPTVDPYGGGDARHWLSEESGYLVLEPGYQNRLYLPLVARNYSGGALPVVPIAANTPTALRLAVFAAPRAVAAMQAVQTGFAFTTVTATTAISLTGQGIDDGDVTSLVSAFELQEISPDDPWTTGIADSADLKYVGVANDFRATGVVTRTNIYFAIATWGDHSTPSPYDAEFDIYIDTTLDGSPDYALFNGFLPAGADPTDVYYTTLVNLTTGQAWYVDYLNGIPADVFDTAAFNTNVMVLPVPASLLGLTAGSPQFTYYVEAYSQEYGLSDESDTLIYTAGMPGLDFSGGYLGVPAWSDLPGGSIPLRFNATFYAANQSQGILLLHHHNGMVGRTEVLTVTPPTDIAVVNFLHTNDFHGNLELAGSNPGIARMAAVINTVSGAVGAANVRLVDAGDEMQGTLLSNLKQGEPTIDLFNFVGYDAATFGNHEFDWGQTVLISRTQQAQYPFIAANLVISDSGGCYITGTVPSFTTPWITMTVGAPGNQVVVGIIGVTSQETPYITVASATQGLCFLDPADSIVHYYDALDAASDVIVVLSHLGNTDGGYGYGIPVYGDQTLARKLVEAGKPVPLIIGGHSHTDLTAAQVVSGTTVVQAYYSGRRVGRAILTVNKTTGAVSVSWQRLVVNPTGRQDPATQARLATWTSDPAYQSTVNQVIGYSNVDLLRNYDGDSLMGKFIDDAIYYDLNTDGTSANDADMVFNNPGGIRVDLTSATKPFTLTYGMLFSVLPFGNQTVVGDMSGAQILELLDQSATLFKGSLQVAGIRFTFYSYTDTVSGPQPWAWGAYSVTVYNRNTSLWEPLVMSQTYRVATNEFLAPAGQDGFTPFKYMTNISYWGDMLDGVIRWVSTNYTITNPYSQTLDGRITRSGTAAGGPVIPVTILHHNDSHGRLLPAGSSPGYTNLAALINQERRHNPTRTLLLNAGDQIQGDAMMAFYKAAFTGYGSDGTTLPITLTTNPIIAAMNAMTYTAMTLGNHEFNFGNYIFTGTLGQATFPLLQANLYDDGGYGIAEVPIRDSVTTTVGAEGIRVAILGIGNHRVPQYELPSNIPGLTFTDPITEAQGRAPALAATNDVVIALTHIGFTYDPGSVEVDTKVDTELARQTVGVDAIIGGHSHTNPATAFAPYKYLPAIVGAPDNTPVIINQAYRYNTYLGEVVLGLLPDGGGGYQVVARAGRYLAVSATGAEDAAIRAIVKPYDDFLATYKNRTVGVTTVPLDALNAFITETNAANLQADAALWKLNGALSPTVQVDFHLSGAMTNQRVAATATATNPYTLTVNDMFTLMPYENSLVVLQMNGPQLKTILERAYRNYWYYRYVTNHGGYSYYTTCMLDISAGGVITYDEDPITYTASVSYVVGLSFDGNPVDFIDATTYYTVSTVNYLAAGACNFSDGGVTLWPLSQIVADTQYYVRDVVIEYIPTLAQPIAPAVEGRLRFQ
jgi:2',3'-cyclic-nucleotide 2'-phosphodiesterase (5'-nucleotidase family)/subtilisin family serine protease